MHYEPSQHMVQINSNYGFLSPEHLSPKSFQSTIVEFHTSDPLLCEIGKAKLTCGDSNPLNVY